VYNANQMRNPEQKLCLSCQPLGYCKEQKKAQELAKGPLSLAEKITKLAEIHKIALDNDCSRIGKFGPYTLGILSDGKPNA